MGSLTDFAKPDETALQLFARTYTEPAPTGVFFLGAVRPGQILEIAGRSGCGKSTFLLQVCGVWIQKRCTAFTSACKLLRTFAYSHNKENTISDFLVDD